MKIRTKIMFLMTAVIAAAVGGMILALLALEQRQIIQQERGRVASVMNSITMTAAESISSRDDLMLLSYLRFQMKEQPDLEICSVTKNGYTTVLGKAKTELEYRTITAAASGDPALAGETVTVQAGFSKNYWEESRRRANMDLTGVVVGIALVGLALGFAGAWWISRSIARPIAQLASVAEKLGKGNLETVVAVQGTGEVAQLGLAFNHMVAGIKEDAEAREDLLSTLTHELNNPLAGLKAFIVLLRRPMHTYTVLETGQVYATMAEAVGQMELTLSDALELFKASAKPVLSPEIIDIGVVVREVMSLYDPVARSNQIDLELSAPDRGPVLMADKKLLRKIAINLLSNAIKYSPEHALIKLRIEDKEDSVEFSVADFGYGISKEDQELLFTKFYRVRDSDGRKTKIPGSGLGLAIARKAVDLHHGKIWIDSEKGKGSTFRVLLPKSGNEGLGSAAKPVKELAGRH